MKSGGLVRELFLLIDGKINAGPRLKSLEKLTKICRNAIKNYLIAMDKLAFVMKFLDTQKIL